MKILYYDCFAGISGDMNLGALIDLGVDKIKLIQSLKGLKIRDEFEIEIEEKQKMGITGTKVNVILKNESHGHDHTQEGHTYEHKHNHDHTHSEHDNHQKGNTHEHRCLQDIYNIIDESSLNENVKKISKDIFYVVAEAEAKIHGKSIEEVHFHEVGAVDSIVDIIGAAVCIDLLQVDKVLASTIELGGGFVKCAHGIMPVPAPATAEILRGTPTHLGKVAFETTTPTGAAILKSVVGSYTDEMDFKIIKVGYGLGTKDFDIPNVLRVFLAETTEDITCEQLMIEVNIDDMNPELFSYVEEQLFEVGASDVYKTAIIMKKGRPAIKLSVLVDSQLVEAVENILFTETTTLGYRRYRVDKIMMQRQFDKVSTSYGEVSIKKGLYKGQLVNYKAEYEECRRLAKDNNVPIQKVYEAIREKVGF